MHFPVLCVLEDDEVGSLYDLLDPFDQSQHFEVFEEENGQIYTYNPNGRWDWWEIGGRWSNALLNKNGEWVNSLPISELDLMGIEKAAIQKATKNWDTWHKLYADLPEALTMFEIIGKHKKVLPDYFSDVKIRQFARQAYENQPRIRRMNEEYGAHLSVSVHTYQSSKRGRYIDEQRAFALILANSIIVDNEWIDLDDLSQDGAGEMISSILKDNQDKYLYIVDCHT